MNGNEIKVTMSDFQRELNETSYEILVIALPRQSYISIIKAVKLSRCIVMLRLDYYQFRENDPLIIPPTESMIHHQRTQNVIH